MAITGGGGYESDRVVITGGVSYGVAITGGGGYESDRVVITGVVSDRVDIRGAVSVRVVFTEGGGGGGGCALTDSCSNTSDGVPVSVN